MDPYLFFNPQNFIYWTLLGLIIWLEAMLVSGKWAISKWAFLRRVSGRERTESQRWWLGLITLFGTSLVMVLFLDWDVYTWLVLLALSVTAWVVRIDRLIFDDLWLRRENHRWTVRYFTAFVVGLVLVLWGWLDVLTWGALFFALGVCGAVKVGYLGFRESQAARKLRAKTPKEAANAVSE